MGEPATSAPNPEPTPAPMDELTALQRLVTLADLVVPGPLPTPVFPGSDKAADQAAIEVVRQLVARVELARLNPDAELALIYDTMHRAGLVSLVLLRAEVVRERLGEWGFAAFAAGLTTAMIADSIVKVVHERPFHHPVADWRSQLIDDSARALLLEHELEPPIGT